MLTSQASTIIVWTFNLINKTKIIFKVRDKSNLKVDKIKKVSRLKMKMMRK